jgi:hypothetical protein
MSSEKEEMQNRFIKWLQKNNLDFFRIGNSAFIHKVTSPYSYAIDLSGMPCHKYWPDIIFPFGGKIYMIEFGIKGRHKDLKTLQALRGEYWAITGGADYRQVFSWEECEKFISELLHAPQR